MGKDQTLRDVQEQLEQVMSRGLTPVPDPLTVFTVMLESISRLADVCLPPGGIMSGPPQVPTISGDEMYEAFRRKAGADLAGLPPWGEIAEGAGEKWSTSEKWERLAESLNQFCLRLYRGGPGA